MTEETFKVGPGIVDVLFMDDMLERHRAFMNRFGMDDGVRIWQCTTAAEAIQLLDRFERDDHKFQQVFLDHDLSLDDIMCPPGGPSKVPTGMDVVDRICQMPWDRTPREVIAHTMNEPAAREMVRRLTGSLVQSRWVPFHMLVK